MASPISSYLRQNQVDGFNRKVSDEARGGVTAPKAAASTAKSQPAGDVLELSPAAQKAVDETGFDQARVDAIKKAISEGGYPIDPRRIAEHFVALERMIN
jgi:negative regulator of flagellin synthesis FlgM